MTVRFRIRSDHVGEFLAVLRDVGVDPNDTAEQHKGVISVSLDDVSYAQARKIAEAFRPEWSAGVGIIGGVPPLEGQ